MSILESVESVNETQKQILLKKIAAKFGEDLTGRTFALWGLAFKPNTDDMRAAPSRTIIEGLWRMGASIIAYDPVAIEEAQRIFGNDPRLTYASSPNDVLKGSDALIVVTEWKEFRVPNFELIKKLLKTPVIFDGRNLYNPIQVKSHGIEYYGIGRLATS
jgi:UDPglucose 6-dehydrogenase